MNKIGTEKFLLNCSKSNHVLERLTKNPEKVLTKLQYEMPEFHDITTSIEYKASSTTTLAVESGSAAAAAYIAPSKL